MAVQFVSGNTGFSVTSNGNTFIVADFNYLTNTGIGFNFGTFDLNALLVRGTIISDFDDAVRANSGSDRLDIVVAHTGVVLGSSDAMDLTTNDSQVTNNGQIVARRFEGVEFVGNNNQLNNFGEITGAFTVGAFASVRTSGVGNSVYNHGQISAAVQEAVEMAGNNSVLVNTGELFSSRDSAVLLSGNGVRFVNDGSVVSGAQDAVQLFGDAGGVLRFVNNGFVSGQNSLGFAVTGDEAIHIVVNSGVIDGGVDLGAGNDRLINSGSISGDVSLGLGVDTYDGRGSGQVSGNVNGGADGDFLLGGDFDDALAGDAGNDFINGAGGDDRLFGGSGNDVIRGGSGDDVISGGSENDFLFGGTGDDEINGDAGDDVIRGNSGNDTLAGGTGTDFLFGGAGEDTFVYQKGWGVDRILDFEDDVDTIDLSDPAFGFTTADDALAFASNAGPNVIFDFGGGDRLVVFGVSVNDLADDILV